MSIHDNTAVRIVCVRRTLTRRRVAKLNKPAMTGKHHIDYGIVVNFTTILIRGVIVIAEGACHLLSLL